MDKVTDWRALVGKRVLVRLPDARMYECEVAEVSPNGKYVKLTHGEITEWTTLAAMLLDVLEEV